MQLKRMSKKSFKLLVIIMNFNDEILSLYCSARFADNVQFVKFHGTTLSRYRIVGFSIKLKMHEIQKMCWHRILGRERKNTYQFIIQNSVD